MNLLNYILVIYVAVVVIQLVDKGITKETVIETLKWPYNVVLKAVQLIKTS